MVNAPSRIRFDDAITNSSDSKLQGREVQKFFKNVNWCLNLDVSLTPAILCESINQFPDGIDLLYKMTKEETIFPDLHGWDHGPYAIRTQKEIEEHLEKSLEWFKDYLGVLPIRWVTPHGANSPEIQAAANKYNLVVETTDFPVVDQKVIDRQLRETYDLNLLNGKIIMNHFWERGLRLYRIAKIIKYQSVEEAMTATRKELNEKEYNICWKNW